FASFLFFFFNDTATTEIYTLSLHDALPISSISGGPCGRHALGRERRRPGDAHARRRSGVRDPLLRRANGHRRLRVRVDRRDRLPGEPADRRRDQLPVERPAAAFAAASPRLSALQEN